MAKSFAEELYEAMEKINVHQEMEIHRVHQAAVRDPSHAYKDVDIKRPDPWRHDIGLSL